MQLRPTFTFCVGRLSQRNFPSIKGKGKVRLTLWLRDEEAAEEVPQRVHGGAEDRGQLHVGRDGHGHHAVEGEEHERQEHEEDVPEELGCRKGRAGTSGVEEDTS